MRELRLTLFGDGIIACRADGEEASVYVKDMNNEPVLAFVQRWLALQPQRPSRATERQRREEQRMTIDKRVLHRTRHYMGVDLEDPESAKSKRLIVHNARIVAFYSMLACGLTRQKAATVISRNRSDTYKYRIAYDESGTYGKMIREMVSKVVNDVIHNTGANA